MNQWATIIGTLNVDINLFVDRIPPPGGECRVLKIKRSLGGKGGNIATAFAKLTGGGRFIGAVGNDEAGRMHFEAFKRLNIDTSGIRVVNDVESGQSYILIDELGQNQVNSYYGANKALDRDLILSQRKAIEGSKVIIVANVDPSLADLAFKISRGIKAYVPASFAVRQPEAVCSVSGDYIFLNQHEMEKVSACITGSFKNVVVTLGSQGAKMIMGDKSISVPGINLEAFGLRVINTTGAGDAFTGAFMAGIYMGLNNAQALILANYAAALKVTKDEARGSPTSDELAKFLSMAGEKSVSWGAAL